VRQQVHNRVVHNQVVHSRRRRYSLACNRRHHRRRVSRRRGTVQEPEVELLPVWACMRRAAYLVRTWPAIHTWQRGRTWRLAGRAWLDKPVPDKPASWQLQRDSPPRAPPHLLRPDWQPCCLVRLATTLAWPPAPNSAPRSPPTSTPRACSSLDLRSFHFGACRLATFAISVPAALTADCRAARAAAKGEPIACAGKRDYTARQNLSARYYAQNQNFRHKRQVFKERQGRPRLPGLPNSAGCGMGEITKVTTSWRLGNWPCGK